jgi:sorting nexin-8
MFNSPRPVVQGRYQASSGLNGLSSSLTFTPDNPLSSSVYDNLDPWSAAPTPPPPAIPAVFANILADATVPPIYTKSLALVDSSATGETSINALIRVISTSGLPSSTIDKIVNLVSSRPRVSKLEFFVALALVALAQTGRDTSIEQVAALAQKNTLPEPSLDLSAVPPSASTIRSPAAPPAPPAPSVPTASPAPAYSETDPWSISGPSRGAGDVNGAIGSSGGAPSTISGGLGKDWWKRLEQISVTILPEKQGFILNRYTLYQIHTDRGPPVLRRYSEFDFLWDCLVRRYPFRLLPSLPPKRLGGDDAFLEQRRKGLSRFLNFVVNHPILKTDGLLSVFLTEPNFEAWRKHSTILLEEESTGKRIERVEEMAIPSDLEDRMTVMRQRTALLVDHWTRFCAIADRMVKRREGAAADASRLMMTLNTMVEENPQCWHSEFCDLFAGVQQGMKQVSSRLQSHADTLEQRSRRLSLATLEELKTQRDLYIALRDLFTRYDRLSPDAVDRLRKRVDSNSIKLESVKAAKKEGWEAEADRVLGAIEKDQNEISSCMARRVFIRHSIWHELRVVLHNRENTLLSKFTRAFAVEERDFAEAVFTNWAALTDEVDGMPFE